MPKMQENPTLYLESLYLLVSNFQLDVLIISFSFEMFEPFLSDIIIKSNFLLKLKFSIPSLCS